MLVGSESLGPPQRSRPEPCLSGLVAEAFGLPTGELSGPTRGCASQVWMQTKVKPEGASGPVLDFTADSDAHIVRGLIAILLSLYSGKPAREILSTDAQALFEKLGLREHLTPQRSNGFRAMVDRIQSDARAALPA